MGDSFHVRHQATPSSVREVLRALASGSVASTGELRGLSLASSLVAEQITRLRKLGLVEKKSLSLTEDGMRCSSLLALRPSVYGDLLHFYHYTLWDASNPNVNRFSWSYRTTCKELWDRPLVGVDPGRLLDRLTANIAFEFPEETSVSISLSTINGIVSWLSYLDPPIMVDGLVQRRSFASPELVVYGIDWLYRMTKTPYGELLMLDDESIRAMSVLCFVDVDAVSAILAEAIQRYRWIEVEERWGLFVRLYKAPDLDDL